MIVRRCSVAVLSWVGIVMAGSASGAIVSVSNVSGVPGLKIAPPSQVLDNAIGSNTNQLGFDEVQNFVLPRDIQVDGGGTILAGTIVSSHMILLNRATGSSTLTAVNDWTFDGPIVGTMSDGNGNLEVATSDILGAPGTIYPTSGFSARGMENPDSLMLLSPNVLRVDMEITQPGDWVRVITVPEPASVGLLLLGALVFPRRRLRTA